MRANANAILTILENPRVGFFSLVKFDWNNTHYFTDFGQNIDWNGNTYLKDNPIVSSDQLRYSNVVDREVFKFTLSGLDPSMAGELAQGIVHMPVTARMIFTVNDVPQTALNQTILLYDGLVSGTSITSNQEEKLITVECTAPLSDLDATGTMFTTKDGMKPFDPTDTSLDNIFEGSEETSLKWGKV